MKTIAQLLKHDFDKGSLYLYDSNNKLIYYEQSDGYWVKREFDSNNNEIYYEQSDGYWVKREFDSNNNEIYYENSDGEIRDNRPKESCEGKQIREEMTNKEIEEMALEMYPKNEGYAKHERLFAQALAMKVRDKMEQKQCPKCHRDTIKNGACEGKIVEIDGKTYKLVELNK